MKTLNIDVRVRRMDAKSILTASLTNNGNDINGSEPTIEADAPARQGAGSIPVRAGF